MAAIEVRPQTRTVVTPGFWSNYTSQPGEWVPERTEEVPTGRFLASRGPVEAMSATPEGARQFVEDIEEYKRTGVWPHRRRTS